MLALAFILVALPAMSFFFTSTKTQITVANGYRIRQGMTLEEVEAVLGGPPRIEGRRTRAELASYKYWDEQEYTEEGIYYPESAISKELGVAAKPAFLSLSKERGSRLGA
ncbi:MAG TPA: hypothetical protein VGY66_21525 [Gemmataceae bacterium]|jgi:hypothetical protein|nr:hypothetical protein [Gemmataceae bacterium]